MKRRIANIDVGLVLELCEECCICAWESVATGFKCPACQVAERVREYIWEKEAEDEAEERYAKKWGR